MCSGPPPGPVPPGRGRGRARGGEEGAIRDGSVVRFLGLLEAALADAGDNGGEEVARDGERDRREEGPGRSEDAERVVA